MKTMESGEVTQLVSAMERGEHAAAEQLLPLIYQQLKLVARAHLRRERMDHTLQPTALLHEAYLALANQRVGWRSPAHFCAVASMAMRRILVKHAVRRATTKRGGRQMRVALDATLAWYQQQCPDLLGLHEALEQLASFDARQSRIVELRFFGGLSVDDTAEVMALSPRTVHREWDIARAWLRRRLAQDSLNER
jgi:RNA polymerase sigma-70 factor, ECF subfamily